MALDELHSSFFVLILLEHELPNELDRVLRSLLRQLFKSVDELGHDVRVQVLANRQVGVGNVLVDFAFFVFDHWVFSYTRQSRDISMRSNGEERLVTLTFGHLCSFFQL